MGIPYASRLGTETDLKLIAQSVRTGGEVGMTKSEVKKALDEIRDMSDEEIADNAGFIRKAAEEAFALIKNLERMR